MEESVNWYLSFRPTHTGGQGIAFAAGLRLHRLQCQGSREEGQ